MAMTFVQPALRGAPVESPVVAAPVSAPFAEVQEAPQGSRLGAVLSAGGALALAAGLSRRRKAHRGKRALARAALAKPLYEQESGDLDAVVRGPPTLAEDALDKGASVVFDDAAMRRSLPPDVYSRFKEALNTGAATSDADMEVLAEAIFKWAREQGAVSFAHWFFPMRGGGGATGGQLAAFKYDTLIDLDWKSKEATKPFVPTLPAERLFFGETDGSSFPNGGLRYTHQAAAFTTWDRSSPCFILDNVLRVPCAFVTHTGKCLDDKTPLLRSNDAVNKEALRLLKNVGIGKGTKKVHSFLGWEQEFFIISAENFKRRPDLVNTGRTLIGRVPSKNQQGELFYFSPPPESIQKLMFKVQAEMLKLGVPLAVMHNEVAPGQHEMSPVFGASTASADSNVMYMEVLHKEAQKLGLAALFHEKPFAGINGSGKHSNWSIQTDTGLNFFHPGKNDEAHELFVTGIAALCYGLNQYNELMRCAAACAGNDHRLGAQEAPPAIISLYPGIGFEEHLDSIIAGGPLLGYEAKKTTADPGAAPAMPAPRGNEDRNRTAPFPHCSNRFEFRAVGSSQNCSFPVAVCNTIMAKGMAALSELIEAGMSHRDAVAKLLEENRRVIYTGNGYSEEWLEEAERRGLPNLKTTPVATKQFNSEKNRKLFQEMGVYSAEECEARQEVMYENYVTNLCIEVETLVGMVETGILPACAKDMEKYEHARELCGDRRATYKSIKQETDRLVKMMERRPADLAADAEYLCDEIKPQMELIRECVDRAEGLLEDGLYPYPTYETMLYSHWS